MKTYSSVIIPTLNNVKGLEYLLNYFKDKSYRVIIVDNEPTNEKKQLIKLLGSRVNGLTGLNYLPLKRNLGFTGSINLGAKDVKTKWMLILNDDIEFLDQKSKIKDQKHKSKIKNNENPVNDLIKFAERKKLDAVSPILVNLDGEIENLGYKILPYGKVELVKSVESVKPVDLDGLTAACLLIKTNVFYKLNGFDESFFAYLEDVDFFLRFKKAGYKMAVSDNIRVLHKHMITSKRLGNFKARQDMINWWRLYFKHKDIFKFNLIFVVERLRNLSGYIKSTFSSFF
jgi:GT2 family glycosyltransferase